MDFAVTQVEIDFHITCLDGQVQILDKKYVKIY